MKKPSRFWPQIKSIAKFVKGLTGAPPLAGLAIDSLIGLQDELAKGSGDAQSDLKGLLAGILDNTAEIAGQLRGDGLEEADEELLGKTALSIAEALYLKKVADTYLYADFKGIEQLEKIIALKLDDVFVNLQVVPESRSDERDERKDELRRRFLAVDPTERDRLEQQLAELDVHNALPKGSHEGQSIDSVLAKAGCAVMLGGPGSGKTTLVKRLARSFALGPEIAKERYPDLAWGLPVVVPIALYDAQAGDTDLFRYIENRLDELGGTALVRAFRRRWGEGECLILLDGLDEVADTTRRITASRKVDDFVQRTVINHVLVTSRPVGYSICRTSVPIEHVVLQPFGEDDIGTFVRNWHLAYDRAIHPDRPDPRQAESEAKDLLDDIEASPRVQSLASNPLMLTIIALIKHQNVTLPERRVQLYEIALNTLMRSWNKARSLGNRPVGEDLSVEEAKKVWGAAADWMHRERNTGTCSKQQLQERLVEILREYNPNLDELKAEQTAESYITSAAERSGLLEARGTNTFAFMHQTFQEYLAARHLAIPHRKVTERGLKVARDPRWFEVIRLTAGFIGVIQEDDEQVTEFVEAIASDASDPLEPFLCEALRLAASCIADDARVRQAGIDRLIVQICDRLKSAYPRMASALSESLASMRSVIPGQEAVRSLMGVANHEDWRVRMEVARMIGRLSRPDEGAVQCLRDLFEDKDADVQAWAAFGLWETKIQREKTTVRQRARNS
jgi:hypothetical protein